jgi:hypothetical protein
LRRVSLRTVLIRHLSGIVVGAVGVGVRLIVGSVIVSSVGRVVVFRLRGLIGLIIGPQTGIAGAVGIGIRLVAVWVITGGVRRFVGPRIGGG